MHVSKTSVYNLFWISLAIRVHVLQSTSCHSRCDNDCCWIRLHVRVLREYTVGGESTHLKELAEVDEREDGTTHHSMYHSVTNYSSNTWSKIKLLMA